MKVKEIYQKAIEMGIDADFRTKEEVEKILEPYDIEVRVLYDKDEDDKYWTMRRESFALLRNHVKGKHTAPFVDDFCVEPDKVPEFLPRMLKILKDHKIKANIAGHAGNGNFHIIPLMDFKKVGERKKIPIVAEKVYDLVAEFKGSITAEHNDGLVRSPYLEKMYGKEIVDLFKQIKNILDPNNIFNPRKKVGSSVEYYIEHMKKD